jgi:hypothetical protein
MKIRSHFLTGPSLVAAVVFGLATVRSAPPESRPGAGTRATPTNAIPQSVFVVPTNTKDGRDPFFPNSDRLLAAGSTTPKRTSTPETALLVLNGLSGTAGRKLAMINGRTLAEGEEAEVSTAGGRVRFRCLEIKTDSVIIEVSGERRELRLRSGN